MEFGEFRSPCAPILTKKYSVLKEEENEIFDNIFSCTAKYFSTPPPKKKKKGFVSKLTVSRPVSSADINPSDSRSSFHKLWTKFRCCYRVYFCLVFQNLIGTKFHLM